MRDDDAVAEYTTRSGPDEDPAGPDSVADLTHWAFSQSRVVMANEAHDGLLRCPRTRRVGQRIVRAAHQDGVRRLAMEALNHRPDGTAGPITSLPGPRGGYLAQPDMRELMATALDLGWTLWAYEAVFDPAALADLDQLRTMESTNHREHEQARHLTELVDSDPSPLLVWCGNGHASKQVMEDWIPMGWRFRELSGVDPFVIDQLITITFPGEENPWRNELIESMAGLLEANGGTLGIRREHAPPPLNEHTWVDGLILSTDNAFL